MPNFAYGYVAQLADVTVNTETGSIYGGASGLRR
jgi:CO/xanthine dehydrogenase Mo-binding subunit